jgi:hypothetical protein
MGNLREGEKGIRNSRETEEEGTEWKTLEWRQGRRQVRRE